MVENRLENGDAFELELDEFKDRMKKEKHLKDKIIIFTLEAILFRYKMRIKAGLDET